MSNYQRADDLVSQARSNTPTGWTAMHRMRSSQVLTQVSAEAAAAIAEELRTANLLKLYALLLPYTGQAEIRVKVYTLILERLDV